MNSPLKSGKQGRLEKKEAIMENTSPPQQPIVKARKMKGQKYPGQGRPKKTPEEKAEFLANRMRPLDSPPYLPSKCRSLTLERVEALLQEILRDELRHQKRCDEFISLFAEKVRNPTETEGGIDTILYGTNVKALIEFTDLHEKMKPATLKTLEAIVKIINAKRELTEFGANANSTIKELDDLLTD